MLQYGDFHLLVGVKSIDLKNPTSATATVDPADLVLHWSGKASTDGEHCAVFTPLGMVTSRSLPGWQLCPLAMGNGIEFRPSDMMARPVRSETLACIDLNNTELESGNTSAIKVICRELIDRSDLDMHLTVLGQPRSIKFVGLPGHHTRNVLQNTLVPGIPFAAEQLVHVFTVGAADARPFLLLGSCKPGVMFHPGIHILYPDTVKALYDPATLHRSLSTAPPPEPRLATGERPPKAPKREHLEIKIEED